jgi:hypothetical protein
MMFNPSALFCAFSKMAVNEKGETEKFKTKNGANQRAISPEALHSSPNTKAKRVGASTKIKTAPIPLNNMSAFAVLRISGR